MSHDCCLSCLTRLSCLTTLLDRLNLLLRFEESTKELANLSIVLQVHDSRYVYEECQHV